MNVRYRVELSQAERDELAALLSGGKHSVRKLKRGRRFCWRPTLARATRRSLPACGWAARPYTGPSAVLCSATWLRRSTRSRALERPASSRAKRKPCWSPRPVQAHLQAAPAGRWNYWRVNWSSLPHTTVSPAKPCAAGWPKTTSSRGARTCGAFRRWMANKPRAARTKTTDFYRRRRSCKICPLQVWPSQIRRKSPASVPA